jgi:hypothetical protein
MSHTYRLTKATKMSRLNAALQEAYRLVIFGDCRSPVGSGSLRLWAK